MTARWLLAGVLVAPIAALALGVWAEFADLGPLLLLIIAVPAIVVATVSAASLLPAAQRPPALVLLAVLLGTLTFGLTEGSYIAIHLSRGGYLNFEGLGSQRAMAAALIGIHLGVGAVVGAGIGLGLTALSLAGRRLRSA